MKLFTALAALTLIAAPAQAEVFSHHMPNVGPTGMTCSTFLRGSSAKTICSRGLTEAELAADEAEWARKSAAASEQHGHSADYCKVQSARAAAIRLDVHNKMWSNNPTMLAMKPGDKGDLVSCQLQMQNGSDWTPFFIEPAEKAAWKAAGY